MPGLRSQGIHPWALPPHPHAIKASKRKVKGSAFVRNVLLGLSGAIFLPILYLYQILEMKHVPRVSTVHESLQNFQNGISNTGIKWGKSRDPIKDIVVYETISPRDLVLTAFLEPPDTLNNHTAPLMVRETSASKLQSISFPNVRNCSTLLQDFPVDDYPLQDPFLPWIHDMSPTVDGKSIQFVAQNRRRCHTGDEEEKTMKFWEPQISLMQSVPVVLSQTQQQGQANFTSTTYRLASSFQEATVNATRFQCRFHRGDTAITTLSKFPFDYEYITWRKGKKALFQTKGKETELFWTSQLLFSCPVPEEFQGLLQQTESPTNNNDLPVMYLDLIPIRTPARQQYLLTPEQTGPSFSSKQSFDLLKSFGNNHFLPLSDDAGRWQNLPVCPRVDLGKRNMDRKLYRMVACTWTSASYTRRGDAVRVSDSAQRLREWITFHLMVGMDHVYIYDNSDMGGTKQSSELRAVAESFPADKLTYHVWPCKICNNNRPAHKDPGERSSQYAAEASCRTRYGELTEWMTFLDTDEYMVPMKADDNGEYTWHPLLDEMDKKGISIMKFRSSRGKPRMELVEDLEDQSVCVDPFTVKGPNKDKTEPCVGPMKNKTFLQVYNCDFIRPPKPERFSRAMKQIYRPSFVLSHFVHYSTVTAAMAMPYTDLRKRSKGREPKMDIHTAGWEREQPEMFMDELTEGSLIHARSVLPHDTRRRSAECYVNSKYSCMMGFLCDDQVEFVDALHQKNVFHNSDGGYCNCWRNAVVEDILVPKLERLLKLRDHKS
ncbi:glycosyltransferase family 92 protein [Nitzschia inconspicua]|uniref:Glycosyltransferase family 92 protein n=1 Tax=Nitzschia inconspicua TaxID=303405 RepID=A0A9K3PGT1_9STRA|nr:glycosyltransferase family 92 protein [Nitzschia inconspicua]